MLKYLPNRWLGLASVLIAALFVAALITGCGSSSSSGTGESSKTDAASGNSQPITRGGTVHIAEETEITGLLPTRILVTPDANVLEQILEPVVNVNEESEVEPWLAESLSSSADKREWTIKLKPGIQFSNGKTLTSADVTWTLEVIRKAPFTEAVYAAISSVKAISPTTVVVKTSVPSPTLPYLLALPNAGIVPENYGGQSAQQFSQHPIGTGPFMLASWKKGQSVTLERNPNYWKPNLPYLDKAIYVYAPDATSRVAQLKSGGLDLIGKPSWAQAAELESNPEFAIAEAENVYVSAVVLNSKVPFLKDPRARRAISLALNRAGITETVLKGRGEPAVAWYPRSVRFADLSLKAPEQNLAEAEKLLKEAVAATGEEPDLELLYPAEEEATHQTSELVQANLEEAGFHVTLKPRETSTAFAEWEKGTFDLFMSGIYTWSPDPVEWYFAFVATEAVHSGQPLAKITKQIEAAAQETDQAKRAEMYEQLQKQQIEEGNIVTVDNYPVVFAYNRKLNNVTVSANKAVKLAEVSLSE